VFERTASEIAQVVGGRLLAGSPRARAVGVSTDSRTIQPGRLFIPLKGERLDGHRFIEEAVEEGAAGALVEEEGPGRPELVRALLARRELWSQAFLVGVPGSSWEAFHRLAADHRSRFPIPVVAVTGSNGKTTTKELVAQLLGARWRTLRSPGNFNNEVGLPLTLLDLGPEFEVLVVEMGMRGRGEIARLCQLARPTAGIVTNVGVSHLELLGSQEAIAAAKAELVEALPSDGLAVLNGDDPWVRAMAGQTRARVVTYGLEQGEVTARDLELGADGARFQLVWEGRQAPVQLPLLGRHNVLNALAAAACALGLGMELAAVADALGRVQAPKLRLERVAVRDFTVLNDAYNASPASMAAALEVLAQVAPGRKGAVLGDMLELGPVTEAEHLAVGRRAAQVGLAYLVIVGEQAERIAQGAREGGLPPEAIHVTPGWERAAQVLERLAQEGDTVLVKASRGLGLERVVQWLQEEGAGHHES